MRQIKKTALRVRKNLERLAEEFMPEDWCEDTLCGACCVGSYGLMLELRRKGIKVKGCIAPGHCFVKYKDKVIDVTATQFGYDDKVLIKSVAETKINRRPHWNPNYWDSFFETDDPNELLQAWTEKAGCYEDNAQHPLWWIEQGVLPLPRQQSNYA